jgi:hypothetical protein
MLWGKRKSGRGLESLEEDKLRMASPLKHSNRVRGSKRSPEGLLRKTIPCRGLKIAKIVCQQRASSGRSKKGQVTGEREAEEQDEK